MGTRGGGICECKGSEVGTSLGHINGGGRSRGEEDETGGLRGDETRHSGEEGGFYSEGTGSYGRILSEGGTIFINSDLELSQKH